MSPEAGHDAKLQPRLLVTSCIRSVGSGYKYNLVSAGDRKVAIVTMAPKKYSYMYIHIGVTVITIDRIVHCLRFFLTHSGFFIIGTAYALLD